MTLQELGEKYGTDKGGPHTYLPLYETLLAGTTSLLEVGVQDGRSLLMWREWLPKARVVGVDIAPRFKDSGVVTIDSRKRVSVDACFSDGSFDVVIDDGSHDPMDQVLTLLNFLPKVRRGGLYVVEDVADGRYLQYFRGDHWFGRNDMSDDRLFIVRRYD